MISFVPEDEIEKSARDFLYEHHPHGTLPIPIEEILEALEIDIIPYEGLLTNHNIDAFLSRDLKGIHIDRQVYMTTENRARFSLAHETGHLVLHGDYIESLEIGGIEEWKSEVLNRGKEHEFLEAQANLFAGYLLMPSNLLIPEFEKLKAAALQKLPDGMKPSDSLIAEYGAQHIGRTFVVSAQSASIRLQRWLNKP